MKRWLRAPLHAAWIAVDWLVDASADRAEERERSLVTEGREAEQRLLWRDMLRLVLLLAFFLAAAIIGDDTLWQGFIFAACGGIIGAQGLRSSQRASAYRTGWIEGRARMAMMAEQHGASGDWLMTEFEHDAVNVVGFRPVISDGSDDDR